MTVSVAAGVSHLTPLWKGVAVLVGSVALLFITGTLMLMSVYFAFAAGWEELRTRNQIAIVLAIASGLINIGCVVASAGWLIRKDRLPESILWIIWILYLCAFLSFAAVFTV